ncbi:MAG: EamA family transporter [Gammaproteobacteria bacterium]|nr:EamA family transporter [Gammaproteobacteria bacterium]
MAPPAGRAPRRSLSPTAAARVAAGRAPEGPVYASGFRSPTDVRTITPATPARLHTLLAFAAIYIIWGTTFLGIALVLRSLPPFLSASLRFLGAGVLLLPVLCLRESRPLAGLPIGRMVLCGVLLVSGGNGLVVWAQQGVPSGIAALVIAATPVVVLVLQRAFFGHRSPEWRTLLGVGIGLTGVLLIVSQIGRLSGTVRPLHVVSLLCAVLSWSLGTLLYRGVPQERVLAGTTVQVLAGGTMLALLSAVNGEWSRVHLAQVSAVSLVALAYLIVFGSVVGQACYLWLLGHVAPQKVTTYALVNPVVAMALGAAVLGERLNALAGFAVVLVLAGVALVLWPGSRRAS